MIGRKTRGLAETTVLGVGTHPAPADNPVSDRMGSFKTSFREWKKKNPRSYNVIVFVLLPLIALIVVSFICGYWIARIEMPKEIEENDKILRTQYQAIFDESREDSALGDLFKDGTKNCVDEYAQMLADEDIISVTNSTNIFRDLVRLKNFLTNCTDTVLSNYEILKFKDAVSDSAARRSSMNSVTYNWIICPLPVPLPANLENRTIDPINESRIAANYYFELEYNKLLDRARQSEVDHPGSFEVVYVEGIQDLKGHKLCTVNLGGGAFFWFTIMTTIGYGNASPTTHQGRAMVATLGFFCILVFTAVSTQAGYVSLAVADDFFKHHGLNRLRSGYTAVLFWLALYHLWNLLIAYIALTWTTYKALNGNNDFMFLPDAFWFAFITSTTVGFGDYFFPHEIFKFYDMFYIPPILLIGFVLLANFIIKFGEWIWSAVGEKNMTVDIRNLRESLEAKSQLEELQRQHTLRANRSSGRPGTNISSSRSGINRSTLLNLNFGSWLSKTRTVDESQNETNPR